MKKILKLREKILQLRKADDMREDKEEISAQLQLRLSRNTLDFFLV